MLLGMINWDLKKKLIAVGLVALLSVSAGIFAVLYQPSSKTDEIYTAALKDFNEGKYQNSYYLFSKISFISNLKPVSIFHRAECAKMLGDTKSELKQYDFLIRFYPKHILALKSRYLTAQKLYEENPQTAQKHFEYIIGEAKIEATSAKSIADAFKSILVHLQKKDFERELVDREIFKETFNEEQAEKIKRILVPSPDDDDIDMQKAFGIFIGYGLNKNLKLDEVDNKKGKKIIEARIEKDIKNICKNIKDKIKENKNLKNYSFYVYVMPFKNEKKDRVEILKNITI